MNRSVRHREVTPYRVGLPVLQRTILHYGLLPARASLHLQARQEAKYQTDHTRMALGHLRSRDHINIDTIPPLIVTGDPARLLAPDDRAND